MAESTPDLHTVLAAACDLNGIYRGKRMPLAKAMAGGIRMPLSACSVDVWGRDVDDNPLVRARGDGDGHCHPITPDPLPMPWTPGTGFLPLEMTYEDGSPSETDPRQALKRTLARFAAKGLTPVVSTELEFYLTEADGDAGDVLSIDALERVGPFLDAVYATCAAQNIPADAAISECGTGQFEINLLHRPDALRAADEALLFKRIVKGCARQHGQTATFMAKPYADLAGSGLHIHFSLLDAEGANVFDDGSATGAPALQHAIGGLLRAMPACALIFAPHQNSYRRLQPDSYAPTQLCWGYENRTTAIRVPGGAPAARRIEHRVAGADANPYLVLAAVLGAALDGLEAQTQPPPPVTGYAYEAGLPNLPTTWTAATQAFSTAPEIDDLFDPFLRKVFTLLKQQEQARFLSDISPFERTTYQDQL